jgi:hypothetical protein
LSRIAGSAIAVIVRAADEPGHVDLHIAQRHSRVEGRHDEPGAQMKKALILRMLLK